ncbi:hypothetical protein BDV28DRAFT_132909 [Aspergillus coremiiformis]|uniref:Uncharacterized protein n=1 Tax=Aspergillus coremiiformis TaxID=138285 RepID=A0A5N6ZBV4_9EURO|nr:hypothetical protein BDV28DRAFT_132909 [Aspergillus coremiiformis]
MGLYYYFSVGLWDESENPEPFAMRNLNMAMVTIDRLAAPASPESTSPSVSRRPSVPKENPPTGLSTDPNLANPRLMINGACIYERHLPGDAYIMAHVQRLQHGFYSSPAVSDQDFDHVDFLGINFVFHSPNTLTHRFKAATIRVSIHRMHYNSDSLSTSQNLHTYRPRNPRFLMHAPHLLCGAVSPETLQWNYSLSGSLGVAQLPLLASISPSGGMNGRYRRYEMMMIQGSVRSLKSPRGSNFDVEAGEIVWSLEENNLQRSGLPREFTFAMLIQKPRADSRIHLALDIDPVLQFGYFTYPTWWLDLPGYKPVPRRPVDFRVEVGQRFEPIMPKKGFNFATLESSLDDYVQMPGRKFINGIPLEGRISQDDNEIRHDLITRDFSMVEPVRSIPQQRMPSAAAGKVPGNRNGVSHMMPIFDPGSLSIQILLDSSNGHSSQRASHLSALQSNSSIAKERDKAQPQTPSSSSTAAMRDKRPSPQTRRVQIKRHASDSQPSRRSRGP